MLRADSEADAREWIHTLDPSRTVEESLTQLRKEYDLLRTEMEQKDETISDLSASLDRGHEMVRFFLFDFWFVFFFIYIVFQLTFQQLG